MSLLSRVHVRLNSLRNLRGLRASFGSLFQLDRREASSNLVNIVNPIERSIPNGVLRLDPGARLSMPATSQTLFPLLLKYRHLCRWPKAEHTPEVASIYSSRDSQVLRLPIPQSHRSQSIQRPQSRIATECSALSRRQLFGSLSPLFSQ